MTPKTVLQLIVVMLLWAICFPLITVGIALAPHLAFATLRAFLAGATLIAVALALGRPAPTEPRIWIVLLGVGLGATGLAFLGMFHAAEFVSPGVATVIASTQPLMAAVLASMFLGERLDGRGKLGLALGFLGILLITWPRLLSGPGQSYALGIAYIFLSALGITASNVLLKWIAGKADAIMAMGIQMIAGGLPLFLGAWAFEKSLTPIFWSSQILLSPRFLLILFSLSLFGTALVYWLWFTVLEKVPLNQANAFSFLIPIFGLTMGVLFFDETLGWLEAGGIGLTLIGIVQVNRKATIRAKNPNSVGG